MRARKTPQQLIEELESRSSEKNRAGMARFGVNEASALGVSMPDIRKIGNAAIKDHDLAEALWQSGIHEARILASLIDIPDQVTRVQMDRWANDFASWDVCDQVCGNLFDRVCFADEAISDWRNSEKEYVKRAAFALIAWRTVHLKKLPDAHFLTYLPFIAEAADDNRNFVKKAVNWALRQIGKRSAELHPHALQLANELAISRHKAANWIGKDAVRELTNPKTLTRLGLEI